MLVEKELTYGLLDTSVLIDIDLYDEAGLLPDIYAISSITLAELAFGVTVAETSEQVVRRSQTYATAKLVFEPIAFDTTCAEIYGQLVALVRDFGRNPRPRRLDLMIAATAVAAGLPLYTANFADLKVIESRLKVIPVAL